jgi:hypothetical protein
MFHERFKDFPPITAKEFESVHYDWSKVLRQHAQITSQTLLSKWNNFADLSSTANCIIYSIEFIVLIG